MAAYVAVVKVVHTLVERSVKSGVKGVSPPSLLFPPSVDTKSRHMEMLDSDKGTHAEVDAASQGRRFAGGLR